MLPFTERTLVLIKPDAVTRGLIGEIISRFERAGLTIVALKLIRPSLEHSRQHYPMTVAQLEQMGNKTLSTYAELSIDPIQAVGTSNAKDIGLMVHERNAEFLASGPVVACVIQGVNAVKKVRTLCGYTMPRDAQPGTIRSDFSSASPAIANMLESAVYNLIHASDNQNDPTEPEREIAHWFSPEEIVGYSQVANLAMFKQKDSNEI
jgi:nucleoside-diphosphate kinase